jgi:hypothetical protein
MMVIRDGVVESIQRSFDRKPTRPSPNRAISILNDSSLPTDRFRGAGGPVEGGGPSEGARSGVEQGRDSAAARFHKARQSQRQARCAVIRLQTVLTSFTIR